MTRTVLLVGFFTNPRRFSILSVIFFAIFGVVPPADAAIPRTVTIRNFFGSLTFDRPLLFQELPGHDSAYVVTQQSGATILVRRENGAWIKSVFDSVGVGGVNSGTAGQDGGLLGFAFHPGYAHNGRYYLYYVASYTVRANPGRILFEERTADSTRRRRNASLAPRLLLSLDKPYIYHNGGTLKFGADGFLYTAIGDGGGANDPENRAQARDSIWGKFLRLDVDGPDAYPNNPARNYGIPADNPFVDSAGYLPEIWALGARSPWKWDWNPFTGEIWLGDIGQGSYEEITRVPRGGNLGWRFREAAHCFNPSSNCPSQGLTPPVFTFPSRNHGISVTGGVFFQGDTASAYHGVYFYGDFGRNKLYALRASGAGAGTTWTDTATLGEVVNLVSLNKDTRGRVFAVSMCVTNSITADAGVVYILESPDMRPAGDPAGIAPRRRVPPKPLAFSEFLKHRDRYEATSLDGRRIGGVPSGAFLVREIGAAGPARLMSGVR
jgi:glucose/arabinose dehydrogenase